jgi:hypothetical protein
MKSVSNPARKDMGRGIKVLQDAIHHIRKGKSFPGRYYTLRILRQRCRHLEMEYFCCW